MLRKEKITFVFIILLCIHSLINNDECVLTLFVDFIFRQNVTCACQFKFYEIEQMKQQI